MKRLMTNLNAWLEGQAWVSSLLFRLVVGFVFLQSGWGKLQNLERVVSYFDSLGIPLAQVQAPFVSVVEFVGGFFLIIGFMTRFSAIPLAATMLVAIATAKASEISSVSDLFGLSEFLYLLILIDLALRGAGALSIDNWIQRPARNSTVQIDSSAR